jgi:hypothetical protein
MEFVGLFTCGLFDDAVNISGYVTSNKLNAELERILKEAVVD